MVLRSHPPPRQGLYNFTTFCVRKLISLGRELLDVLLDGSDVEADDGGELLDVAVALAEEDVWDGAHAELASEFTAVLDVDLDEQNLRVLISELWKLTDEPLAWSAPGGEEVDNDKAAVVVDPGLEIVIRVGALDEEVAWVI